MPAGQYLLGNAAYQRQKRATAKARGFCIACLRVRVTRYWKCVRCRNRDAAGKRAMRAALREAA